MPCHYRADQTSKSRANTTTSQKLSPVSPHLNKELKEQCSSLLLWLKFSLDWLPIKNTGPMQYLRHIYTKKITWNLDLTVHPIFTLNLATLIRALLLFHLKLHLGAYTLTPHPYSVHVHPKFNFLRRKRQTWFLFYIHHLYTALNSASIQ